MQKIIFEVCANSFQSAIAAMLGGADRIELCAQLEEGGITPSAATIKLVNEYFTKPAFVLIRPRGGDFVYDDTEFWVMKEDIAIAKLFGSKGVVIGILKPNGDIDIERTAELVSLARPMQVTFHRAFDRAREPLKALEDVIKTGADRILTSGQANSALEGKELLKTLVQKANGRIIIMAGAGINPRNVSEIIEYTGITEVHASCSTTKKSKMEFINGLDSPKNMTITNMTTVKKINKILTKRSENL
jgi:copper homeostasis protein